ncbi:MAG: response regulator, partial [Rubrivivax sp.]
DRLLRESLVRDTRLSSPDWRVLDADGLAAAREAARAFRLDAVFLDLGLPDGDGVALIRELRQAHPACEVLVITVFADEQRVIASLEAGAAGYILKGDLPAFSGRLIATIEAGGSPVSPAIARQLIARLHPGEAPGAAPAAPPPPGERLSAREAEILALCSKGLRYAEVALALGVSVHTVNAHLKNVYRKLLVNSRAEAVYEARRSGLLHD